MVWGRFCKILKSNQTGKWTIRPQKKSIEAKAQSGEFTFNYLKSKPTADDVKNYLDSF